MMLHHYLTTRLDQVRALCREHGVDRLFAFGSIVSGKFDIGTSDIDLQVELLPVQDPVEKGLKLLEFWDALEELFERRVDLLTEQPIRNPVFRKVVEETKVLVYDRASQEIPV